MRSLQIEEVEDFGVCRLVDELSKKQYKIVLDFYKIKKPKVKDKILIEESLIDERSPLYSQTLFFEPATYMDISTFKNVHDREYVVLQRANKTLVMRRVYG